MLEQGGFKDLPPGPVAALTYLRLPADPTGFEIKPFATEGDAPLSEAVAALHQALSARIAAYLLSDALPMVPDILPKKNQTYAGDYDHLSRRAEWAAAEDAEAGE
jgi:ATP-dependent helicase/nuclease subunit B